MSRATCSAPNDLRKRTGFEGESGAHRGAVRNRRGEPVEEAEHAAAREHHDEHQQEADPEQPIGRIVLGELVLRDHVERRADEGAVEPADAAEDQHDEDGAGELEAQDLQPDELGRLGEEAAGDAGERRRDRVDAQAAQEDRRADRMHAHLVLADAGQRAAERRMDDRARQAPGEEQHGEAVEIGGAAEHVEAEEAEHRRDLDALQPVGAAGQPAEPVGRLLQHLRGDAASASAG